MKFLVLQGNQYLGNVRCFCGSRPLILLPAQDSETEQIGLRMGIEGIGGVGEEGGVWEAGGCAPSPSVCAQNDKNFCPPPNLHPHHVSTTKTPLDAQIKARRGQ